MVVNQRPPSKPHKYVEVNNDRSERAPREHRESRELREAARTTVKGPSRGHKPHVVLVDDYYYHKTANKPTKIKSPLKAAVNVNEYVRHSSGYHHREHHHIPPPKKEEKMNVYKAKPIQLSNI